MSRIGDLIPDAAAAPRPRGRAPARPGVATFDAIVAEPRRPRTARAARVRVEGEALIVEADAPIVGQELRLHARQLAEAFRAAPAGAAISEIRVTVRTRGCVFGRLTHGASVR